jgi:hypothetical protein
METPVLVAGAALVLLVLVGVLVLVARGRSSRRALGAALAEAQVETAELRARLDRITEQLEHQSSTMIRMDDPAFVITDAGRPATRADVPDRVVLSAAVGEPLVKVVAFGHGVRRALSPESRNRIWFEMRREVRRARKQRRREMKDAWRRVQAQERAAQDDAA